MSKEGEMIKINAECQFGETLDLDVVLDVHDPESS